MSSYRPDYTKAPRYTGIRTFMKLGLDLKMDGSDVAVIGLPFDTGASFRAGARFGPAAIREMSVLLRPAHSFHKINPFEHVRCVDYGDLPLLPGYMEDSFDTIRDTYRRLAREKVIPVGLGGDHSVTLAELRGLADVYGPLSLVHFDAHGDTWDEYWGKKYTHGTPFRRALEEEIIDPHHSVQIGLRGTVYHPDDMDEAAELGFEVIAADELHTLHPTDLRRRIENRVGDRNAFLTFDIDFFDPAYAPGTGTPEVGGFTSHQGLTFVRHLPLLNYVGFDLVEVLPAHDHSQNTALLGAAVVYEFLALIALNES